MRGLQQAPAHSAQAWCRPAGLRCLAGQPVDTQHCEWQGTDLGPGCAGRAVCAEPRVPVCISRFLTATCPAEHTLRLRGTQGFARGSLSRTGPVSLNRTPASQGPGHLPVPCRRRNTDLWLWSLLGPLIPEARLPPKSYLEPDSWVLTWTSYHAQPAPQSSPQQVALLRTGQPRAHAGLVRLATSPGLAWSILHTLAAALPYCETRCLLHPPSHPGSPVPREQALLLEALAL